MNKAEGMTSDILGIKACPMERPHVAEGRNVQWTTNPLPSNSRLPHRLPAPKPDRHYGYPTGPLSGWTIAEMAVVAHSPTHSPLRITCSTGGVLYTAEHQSVGSSVHSVNSLRWLLEEAYPTDGPKATDAVAFTGLHRRARPRSTLCGSPKRTNDI